MNCPICNSATTIEVDMHADGYAKNLIECAKCEALWTATNGEIVLLNNKKAA